MLSDFASLTGRAFLIEILKPTIVSLLQEPGLFEVNPTRVETEATLAENRQRLRSYAERFLQVILDARLPGYEAVVTNTRTYTDRHFVYLICCGIWRFNFLNLGVLVIDRFKISQRTFIKPSRMSISTAFIVQWEVSCFCALFVRQLSVQRLLVF
jgi:hypothetical protein